MHPTKMLIFKLKLHTYIDLHYKNNEKLSVTHDQLVLDLSLKCTFKLIIKSCILHIIYIYDHTLFFAVNISKM